MTDTSRHAATGTGTGLGLPVRNVAMPGSSSDVSPSPALSSTPAPQPSKRGIRVRINSLGAAIMFKQNNAAASSELGPSGARHDTPQLKTRLRSATFREKPIPSATPTASPAPSPSPSLDHGTGSSSATSLPLPPSSAANTRSPPLPPLTPRHSDSSSAAGSSTGFNRRKFFGRSNSIRYLLGGGSGKNDATGSSSQPAQDGASVSSSSAAGGPPSLGLLRRMGSKSILNLNQPKAGPANNSSTDDLSSVASIDSQASRRFSDSLKGMGRRRGKSVSKGAPKPRSISSQSSSDAYSGRMAQSESLPGNSRKSIESARSSRSIASSDPQHRSSEVDSMESKGQPISDNHDQYVAAPRRLTGWLYNMVGSDNTQSSLDGGAPLSPVREADVLEAKPSSPTKRRPDSRSSVRSPSRQSSTAPFHSELGSPTTAHANTSTRAKTGGLFSGLANVGSNKSVRAINASTGDNTGTNSTSSSNGNIGSSNTAGSSAMSGGNVGGGGSNIGSWVPGGVGFDRAFKFFMDPDNGSGSDEGIWLLGVWHGPRQSDKAERHGNQEASSESAALPTALDELQLDSARRESEDEVADMMRASSPSSSVSASSPRRKPVDLIHASLASSSPVYERASATSTKESSRVGSSMSTAATVSTVDSLRTKSSATSFSAAAPTSVNADADVQSAFQSDFASRIWCTYRNHFAPISRDGTISEQAASAAEATAAAQYAAAQRTADPSVPPAAPASDGNQSSGALASAGRNWLGRKTTESNAAQEAAMQPNSSLGLGTALGAGYASASSTLGEKMGITNFWSRATAAAQAAGFSRAGLTTDSGWGCMLRTGQSLLANALVNVHLSRSWQREAPPTSQVQFLEELANASMDSTAETESLATFREKRARYATYIKILSWFLDDPSPACPFGVHRMAREGKRLGKEVGEWFGPSTAAGAIKQLVSEFPDAGIAVELAHDGVFYLDEVRAAANSLTPSSGKSRSSRKNETMTWRRPVLILIGIRLGLDSVNPIYYESVKATFSFPHSVGIAGGRPSSSYYFMGHQGNSLFYLDPHNVRPTVPLRYPPSTYPAAVPCQLDVAFRYTLDDKDDEQEWWSHAYSEAQTSTFHCEKVRRMPIKSLDPSMLLGFLVKDEDDLLDLCARIKALPKTIFSFAESAPNWVDDDDFDPSMESFSEHSVDGETQDEADEGRGQDSKSKSDSRDLGKEGGLVQQTHATSVKEESNVPSPGEAESTGGKSFRETQQQRTAAWLGHGQPSSNPSRAQDANANAMGSAGIAFPSLDLLSPTEDGHLLQRPSRSDARQASTSSAATTRPSRREAPNVLSTDRLRGRDPQTSAALGGPGQVSPSRSPATLNPDESFSTVHLSDSEAGSAWEEVSDGGTIAPSGSSGAAPLRTGSPMRTLLAPTQPASTVPMPTDNADINRSSAPADDNPMSPVSIVSEGEFVGVSLDTSVHEVPSNVGIATPTESSGVPFPGASDAAKNEPGPAIVPVVHAGEGGSYFGHTSAHTPLALPRRRSQSKPSPVEPPAMGGTDAPPVPSIPANLTAPKKARAPDMNDSDDDF